MDPNSSNNQNDNNQKPAVTTSHVVIPAPAGQSPLGGAGSSVPNLSVSNPVPFQDPNPIMPSPLPIVETVNPFASQIPSSASVPSEPIGIVVPVIPQTQESQSPLPVVGPMVEPVNPIPSIFPISNLPPVEPVPPVESPVPNPLLTQEPLVDNTVNEIDEKPKKGRSNKKIGAIALIILFIVALPITIFVSQNQQNTQSGAAVSLTPDTVIAVFNGQNITEKDVEKVALEQYDSNSIDTQALKDAEDILIERKTLDYEKTQKSITVSQDEINQKEADGFDLVQAPYEVLKDKVTIANTKNWQAFSIDFWLPPKNALSDLTQAEKNTRAKQLEAGLNALDDAKDQLQTQKSPLDIARDLITKYPSLAPILGVNGYLVKELGNNANLLDVTAPKLYTYEGANTGQPFFDTLYSMKNEGQVKKAISANESGGSTIKLIKASSGAQYNNYEDWLKAKEDPLVRRVYSL